MGPRGVPVGLIQDEHLDAAQVEGRAVVEVVDEPARGGDEDVGYRPKSCFLRLHVQAACEEKSPTRQAVQPFNAADRVLPPAGSLPDAEETAENALTKAPCVWILQSAWRDR